MLFVNGRKLHKRIHRLVAEAFIPNPNNLPEVNHKDGDKTNNHVSNLEWASRQDNVYHAISNKLYKIGEDSIKTSLTNKTIHAVCRCLESGKYTISEISELYKVSVKVIYNILFNDSWREISTQYNIHNYKSALKRTPEYTVHEICELLSNGIPVSEIHRITEASMDTIYAIKLRKYHKDISKNYDF